jgi:hypothetical protein
MGCTHTTLVASYLPVQTLMQASYWLPLSRGAKALYRSYDDTASNIPSLPTLIPDYARELDGKFGCSAGRPDDGGNILRRSLLG